MTQLQPFRYTGRRLAHSTRILDLSEITAVSPRTGAEHVYTRLESPEWINVVALTPELDLILVRQWRHGTERFTLEIPGGLVDPGEDPAIAAVREVREETGYAGDAATLLGIVESNPAIFNNRTHTYLIENCREVGELQQDDGEDIEVVRLPLAQVPDLVRQGAIDHSLVICGFWWLALQRPDLLQLG